MTYDICFLRSVAYQTDFFVILGHFLLFYPTNNPKSQNFEKIKKMPGIIILCKCTKNHDHMLYWFWDMACDGCNFYFSFLAVFCPFTPLGLETGLEISSFYTCVPKIMIRWCTVPEIWCGMDGRMDRRMDRWKKWHKEMSAPPNKEFSLTNETMKRKIDVWC